MGLKQGALRGWLGLFWTNSCGKSSTKVFFCGSGQWRLRAEGGRYLSIQCVQPNIWQPNGSRVLRVGRPLAPAALPPLPRSLRLDRCALRVTDLDQESRDGSECKMILFKYPMPRSWFAAATDPITIKSPSMSSRPALPPGIQQFSDQPHRAKRPAPRQSQSVIADPAPFK